MQGVDIQPHIKISKEQTRPVVIVVGDPARAKLLASLCDTSTEIAYNREYRTFDCKHRNQSFLVTSHGVGSAGAVICFEELIANGAKIIIRAGTAGSLQPAALLHGDVVVCHSAVREDGATRLLVPKGFPAIADPYVFETLREVSRAKSNKISCGMAVSTCQYYRGPILASSLENLSKVHVDVVEMEMGALFVIARIRGIKAGALCTVDGCPLLSWQPGDYEEEQAKLAAGKQLMLQVALDVAVRCALEKNW